MVDMWSNFATYGKPIPSPDEMLEGGKKKLDTLVISFKRIFPLYNSSSPIFTWNLMIYFFTFHIGEQRHSFKTSTKNLEIGQEGIRCSRICQNS